MRVELTEMIWFEEHVVTLSELGELTGLPEATLAELVSCGAIEPIETAGGDPRGEPRFGASALVAARHARRLREDFELDTQALPLVLGLLDRIDALEQQLRSLRARSPGKRSLP
jgi:chaperone modulatory protein CbpM